MSHRRFLSPTKGVFYAPLRVCLFARLPSALSPLPSPSSPNVASISVGCQYSLGDDEGDGGGGGGCGPLSVPFSSPQTHLLPYNAVYCTVGNVVIADFDSKRSRADSVVGKKIDRSFHCYESTSAMLYQKDWAKPSPLPLLPSILLWSVGPPPPKVCTFIRAWPTDRPTDRTHTTYGLTRTRAVVGERGKPD